MTSALGHDLLGLPALGWANLLTFSFVDMSRLWPPLSFLGPLNEPPLSIP